MHRSTVALIALVAVLVGFAFATYNPVTRTDAPIPTPSGSGPYSSAESDSYDHPKGLDQSCITYDGDYTNDTCK